MVEEVLRIMGLKPGDAVVDGTLGLGGHSLRFAKAVSPGGTVIGLDWDQNMLAEARKRLESVEGARIETFHSDFRDMQSVLQSIDIRPNGILLDLGLNSAQVDDPERGLSFLREGPLEMRMDQSKGEPAAALLNRLSPGEIEQILFDYGDERWAKAIAKKIVEVRKTKPLKTTQDLVDAVMGAVPAGARDKRIHPATRTFQAVRIAVNKELDGLGEAMQEAGHSLAFGGTLVVLSYHSGEDRITKQSIRELSATGEFTEVVKKPLLPTAQEIAANPRARSAKLRAVRKV